MDGWVLEMGVWDDAGGCVCMYIVGAWGEWLGGGRGEDGMR